MPSIMAAIIDVKNPTSTSLSRDHVVVLVAQAAILSRPAAVLDHAEAAKMELDVNGAGLAGRDGGQPHPFLDGDLAVEHQETHLPDVLDVAGPKGLELGVGEH